MRHPVHPILMVLLSPFSLLYGIVVWIRNLLFDFNVLPVREFDVPVISIGNIAVGGTGKTPHVEYLIRLLRKDFIVAVLSRGYKRKTRGFFVAERDSNFFDIGDEPCQIKSKFPDVEVIVDKYRVRALRKIEKEKKHIHVVLLDDAFQYRSVKPGLSVLLIDYNLPLSKDFYLPVGRLRESKHAKKRANIIIFTKCPEKLKPIEERIRVKKLRPSPYQQVYFTKIVYGDPAPVFAQDTGCIRMDDIVDKETSVLAVTGIANPVPFLRHITLYTDHIESLVFPDHHKFKRKDIEHIIRRLDIIPGKKKVILTTEKDAVRLSVFRSFDMPNKGLWYFIPIAVSLFQETEKKDFENKILRYVRNNQRNRSIHPEQN